MIKNTNKIIQALNYLACKNANKTMGFRRAFKLLWLIDRYSLRHYTQTVTGDTYYAMPYGPVPTDAKSLLENTDTHLANTPQYQNAYIRTDVEHKIFTSVKSPDMDVFSESDIEVMDKVWNTYKGMSTNTLISMSHKFPEWKTYEADIIEGQKKSYIIDTDLFFDAKFQDDIHFFDEKPEVLALACETYNECKAY
jgi:uncharacterized phage-associated protein